MKDREGLSEYRPYLQRLSFNENPNSITYVSTGAASNIISEIFGSIDRDNNGRLSVEEAERIFLRLNSRLGRRYGISWSIMFKFNLKLKNSLFQGKTMLEHSFIR